MKSLSTHAMELGLLTIMAATVMCKPSNPLIFISRQESHQKVAVREDPEVFMNATQLITSKGFPCENHYVTTDDGFILNVLRIPHGRNPRKVRAGPKPVVVLQHGFLGSCTNYLTNPVNESLAYILADAGAEVWLGNSRGTFYSRNHTHLKPSDKEFWEFSFDEMAKYDLPAMINYVTSKAGVEQVFYVGHSQGTTQAFIAFGENEELAAKIKHFIALAPVARVGHTESPIKKLAPLTKYLEVVNILFGRGELNVDPSVMQWLAGNFCDKWGEIICEDFLFLLCGFNEKSMNKSRVPVYVAHNPSSTSVNDLVHWGQEVNTDLFQAYDYMSAQENIKHYGQPTPPIYDPKKVKVPVAIFRGGQDWLANPTDVSWLLPQLNVSIDVNIDYYEHLDFIWAMDAPTVIYPQLLKVVFS